MDTLRINPTLAIKTRKTPIERATDIAFKAGGLIRAYPDEVSSIRTSLRNAAVSLTRSKEDLVPASILATALYSTYPHQAVEEKHDAAEDLLKLMDKKVPGIYEYSQNVATLGDDAARALRRPFNEWNIHNAKRRKEEAPVRSFLSDVDNHHAALIAQGRIGLPVEL